MTYTLNSAIHIIPPDFVTTESRISSQDIVGKDVLPLLGAYVLNVKLNQSGIRWSEITAAVDSAIEIKINITSSGTGDETCDSFSSFFNITPSQTKPITYSENPYQLAMFSSDSQCCTASEPATDSSDSICYYTKAQGLYLYKPKE